MAIIHRYKVASSIKFLWQFMINDKSYFWFLYWFVVKCPNVSEEHTNSIFKVNELSLSGCKRGGGCVGYVGLLANQ